MNGLRGILKSFVVAAMIILLLLFAFWGFLQYQDYASYENAIHKNAGLIIKVSRNQLVTKIGLNALANPGYYFKTKEEASVEAEKDEEREIGFDTRANIFVYNLKDAPTVFYSTFKVTDSAALKIFLKDKIKMNDFVHKERYNYGFSSDGKLQATYNNSSLVFSYAFDKKHDQGIIEEIVNQKEFLNPDHTLIGSLKENDKDIVVTDGRNVGNLTFESGEVLFSASLQMEEYFEIPDQLSFAEVDTSGSFHVSLAGNIPPALSGNYMFNNIKIPLDSILYNYNSYMTFKVSGKTNQADTITTYEYNDDFEKIETKLLQEKKVPGVSLWVKGNAAEIHRLLVKENVVCDNQINRELFPLLNLSVKAEDPGTIRISNLEMQRSPDSSNSGGFFFLYTNFTRLRTDSAFPIPDKYFEDLKKLEITASKIDGKIAVNGQLSLNDVHINALMQLMNFIHSL